MNFSYITDVTHSGSQTIFVDEESKNMVQWIRGTNGLVLDIFGRAHCQ